MPPSSPSWPPALLEIALRRGWMPVAVLAVHFLTAEVLGVYRAWPAWDRPMHLAGGMSIAYLAAGGGRILERRGLLHPLEGWLRALLAVTSTATAAVLWELAEWLSDRYLGTRLQASLTDTLLDLLLGLAGGALYAAVWAWRSPDEPPKG